MCIQFMCRKLRMLQAYYKLDFCQILLGFDMEIHIHRKQAPIDEYLFLFGLKPNTYNFCQISMGTRKDPRCVNPIFAV